MDRVEVNVARRWQLKNLKQTYVQEGKTYATQQVVEEFKYSKLLIVRFKINQC